LAGLLKLKKLHIEENPIIDYSLLLEKNGCEVYK